MILGRIKSCKNYVHWLVNFNGASGHVTNTVTKGRFYTPWFSKLYLVLVSGVVHRNVLFSKYFSLSWVLMVGKAEPLNL